MTSETSRTQQDVTVDFPRLSWNRHRRFLTSFFLGYHGDLRVQIFLDPSAARQAHAFSPRRHASSPTDRAGVSPLSRSVVHHQLVVARLVEVAGRQSTRSDVHLIVETECWPTPMAAGAAWWPRLIPLGPVPISSGSVAIGDRFLSGPAVPAASPPPVPVVPFGGGLNWWTRRWS